MSNSPAIDSAPIGKQAAHLVRVARDGAQLNIAASGRWTIRELAALEPAMSQALSVCKVSGVAAARLDLTRLQRLDTAGAWLIHRTLGAFGGTGTQASLVGVRQDFQVLLDAVGRNTAAVADDGRRTGPAQMLAAAATAVSCVVKDLAGLVGFLGLFLAALGRVLLSPKRFRLTSVVYHLEHTGLRAAPIIALICFLIGAVIMQQAAVQLSTYGAEAYSVSMLGVLALREVGVLLTAVMVAGRSASAFTAEIGAMKMREEIDAMRILGIDPVDTLVVPRILALLIALPLLTFIGDIACLVGGGVVAVFYLDQDISIYLDRLHDTIAPRHFLAGMIKAPLAALVIGIVGCSEGLKVAGNAESLGRHVTSAVVKAIFLVIILSALLAMFLVSAGI